MSVRTFSQAKECHSHFETTAELFKSIPLREARLITRWLKFDTALTSKNGALDLMTLSRNTSHRTSTYVRLLLRRHGERFMMMNDIRTSRFNTVNQWENESPH